jgi:hypothetical protein
MDTSLPEAGGEMKEREGDLRSLESTRKRGSEMLIVWRRQRCPPLILSPFPPFVTQSCYISLNEEGNRSTGVVGEIGRSPVTERSAFESLLKRIKERRAR